MDFENHKSIAVKWDLRFFGKNFDLDINQYKAWNYFASSYHEFLDLQDAVYLPIIRLERKLFFEGDTYHKEVSVRKTKMAINWSSNEAFNNSFKAIIGKLMEAKNKYTNNKKGNKKNQNGNTENANDQNGNDETKNNQNGNDENQNNQNANDPNANSKDSNARNKNHNNSQQTSDPFDSDSDEEEEEEEMMKKGRKRNLSNHNRRKKKKTRKRKRKLEDSDDDHFEDEFEKEDKMPSKPPVRRRRLNSNAPKSFTKNSQQRPHIQSPPTKRRGSFNPTQNTISTIFDELKHNENGVCIKCKDNTIFLSVFSETKNS